MLFERLESLMRGRFMIGLVLITCIRNMLQRKGSKLVMPGVRYSLLSEIQSVAVPQLF